MKKKGYYEYDPVIYPRKVWVHIGTNFKELASEIFEGELIFDDKTYDGAVFEEVIRKSDDEYGILATFPSSKEMTMGVCSHEASHICDAIEKAIGMEHGGERVLICLVGLRLASTKLVWVLEILLRLIMMKLISKEEVKKNHEDILGLDLLLAENFPPYSRFLEKCLNT